MKSLFRWSLILFVFTADRALKLWVLGLMKEGESLAVWPGVFHLTLVHNAGAAFGLWPGARTALTVFSAVSLVLIALYLSGRIGARVSHAAAWACIAGGAAGNLYDRLMFGRVIDYLDFRIWPVFNLADACIFCGAAWILLKVVRRPHGPRRSDPHASGPG